MCLCAQNTTKTLLQNSPRAYSPPESRPYTNGYVNGNSPRPFANGYSNGSSVGNNHENPSDTNKMYTSTVTFKTTTANNSNGYSNNGCEKPQGPGLDYNRNSTVQQGDDQFDSIDYKKLHKISDDLRDFSISNGHGQFKQDQTNRVENIKSTFHEQRDYCVENVQTSVRTYKVNFVLFCLSLDLALAGYIIFLVYPFSSIGTYFWRCIAFLVCNTRGFWVSSKAYIYWFVLIAIFWPKVYKLLRLYQIWYAKIFSSLVLKNSNFFIKM